MFMRFLLALLFTSGHFLSIAQEKYETKIDTLLANEYMKEAKVLQDSARYDSSIYYFKAAAKIYKKAENWEKWIKAYNWIGWNYKGLSYYDKALFYLQESLDKGLKKLGNKHSKVALTYNHIGNVYDSQGSYQKALEYYQKALDIMLIVYGETHSLVASIYGNKGLVYKRLGSYQKALEYYEKALKIYLETGGKEHHSVALTYRYIGNIYHKQSHYQKALEYYQKALEIDLKTYGGEHPYLAHIYGDMGIVCRSQGAYEKALEYYQKELNIYLKVLGRENISVAKVYHNLGNVYANQSNYDKALEYHQKVLEIALNVLGKNHPKIELIHCSIANVYEIQGAYEKALEYFQKALSIALKVYGKSHSNIASIYSGMGLAYANQGSYQKALEYYQKALNIGLKTLGKEHPNVASIYNNMGLAYRYRGVYEKVLEYYQKALKIQIKTLGREHPDITTTYMNLGLVYADQGFYEKAFFYYEKAIHIQLKILGKKHSKVALTYNNMGLTYQNQGFYQKALFCYQKELIALGKNFKDTSIYINPILDQIISKPEMLRALISKSAILKNFYYKKSLQLKDLQLSFETYQLAASLLDTMRNDYLSIQSKQKLTEKNIYNVYEGAISTAYELYNITKDSNYLYQAFTISERSKAYLLRQALNESKAKQFAGIADSLLESEKDLKIKISFYEKSLFNAQHPSIGKEIDTLKVKNYQNNLFDLKREYEKLVAALEKNYPEYYQIKYETKVASVEYIRENLLDGHSAFVEYFAGDSALYVFAITKEKIQFHSIKDLGKIQEAAQELQSMFKFYYPELSLKAYEQFTEPTHLLYQKLLAPIVDSLKIKPKKIIIASDGAVSYLPFELLLYKEAPLVKSEREINYAELPYLLNDYQISYTYSATLLRQNKKESVRIHKRDKGIRSECLAFAPTYGKESATFATRGSFELLRNEELKLLPGAKKEAQNISKYADGKFLFDAEASEANFKREATNYSIIHLATHAEVEDKDPLYSKIYFTNTNDSIEDDTLHTYELYNMKLNADLVVLSGCSTGLGKYVKGEGVMSLSRGFMYAGAPSIVLSLWQVSDEHTSNLMDYFYKALSEGLAKGEALQKAKKQYLQKVDAFTSHPYYWASFILHGDEKPISLSREINPWWWLGGITLVLLLVSIVVKKRRR